MRDEIQNSQIPPSAVVREWAKTIEDKSDLRRRFFETASDVPDPRELNPEDKNLMIFDDLLLEKQNKCESYYIRGRHSNVDCFYLSQNYFKLPRQTIRENANFICLFSQDKKNINHIYSDHVGDDMPKDEFRKFCYKCLLKPFGFALSILRVKKMMESIGKGLITFLFPLIKMEVKLLEKIAINTSHKTSFQIVVSGNESSFNTMFSPNIELAKDRVYEIALVNLKTYYSFPNIDETNNIFVYSPDNGNSWVKIKIPEGSYEIDDINNTIQHEMEKRGHYDSINGDYYVHISANSNTLKSVLIIEKDYQVDFNHQNSLAKVLGFTGTKYTEGFHESENVVNILTINSILVNIDIISGSYVNAATKSTIYSFFRK